MFLKIKSLLGGVSAEDKEEDPSFWVSRWADKLSILALEVVFDPLVFGATVEELPLRLAVWQDGSSVVQK